MTALALALLIYFAVAGVWDLLEPKAVTIKFGSPMRAVLALGAQFAILALCFIVLAASAGTIVLAAMGYVVLIAFGLAVDQR